MPLFEIPETGTTMGPAGMGSAPPNFSNYSMPDFSARESYINEMNNPNSMTNYLNQHNQQQESWENLEGPGYRILGPASPWNPLGGTVGPEAYPKINEDWMPGVNDYIEPSWMEAGWFGDPTANGGWLDNLSRWWYGDDDPENDYLDLPPSDGFEPYNPENPNHFMIPPDMDIEDMDIEDIIKQMQGEKLEANLESNDLFHYMRNGYTLEEAQEILNEQIGDGSFETAKVYTNQDPGMIDEGYLWDDFTPGAEAINDAYNYLRSGKPLYGSNPQDLRDAINHGLFEDERLYRNLFPRNILKNLPEDAFENLEDFQNQQLITII